MVASGLEKTQKNLDSINQKINEILSKHYLELWKDDILEIYDKLKKYCNVSK